MTLSTEWVVFIVVAYWLSSLAVMELLFTYDDQRLEKLGLEPTSRSLKIAFYVIAPSVLGLGIILAPFFGLAVILKWIIMSTGHPKFLATR